jgi:hypothetical protein
LRHICMYPGLGNQTAVCGVSTIAAKYLLRLYHSPLYHKAEHATGEVRYLCLSGDIIGHMI